MQLPPRTHLCSSGGHFCGYSAGQFRWPQTHFITGINQSVKSIYWSIDELVNSLVDQNICTVVVWGFSAAHYHDNRIQPSNLCIEYLLKHMWSAVIGGVWNYYIDHLIMKLNFCGYTVMNSMYIYPTVYIIYINTHFTTSRQELFFIDWGKTEIVFHKCQVVA